MNFGFLQLNVLSLLNGLVWFVFQNLFEMQSMIGKMKWNPPGFSDLPTVLYVHFGRNSLVAVVLQRYESVTTIKRILKDLFTRKYWNDRISTAVIASSDLSFNLFYCFLLNITQYLFFFHFMVTPMQNIPILY